MSKSDLVFHIGVAMQEYQRAVDQFDQRVAERLGINRTDMYCLELAFTEPPLSPSELAAAVGMTTGGVTTVIDRLVRAGYVTRERDEADRRRVIVRPTEEATQLVNEYYGPLMDGGNDYLDGLDTTTLERILAFLRFVIGQQLEQAARLAT